jgi:hypothetical protein
MPIPEPGLYRPSNLSKAQQQSQLQAIYGVPVNQELTYEEIQRMRQIVQQFDAERKPMQTIDLNNPPKEPYRFQKFPKMVYDLTRSKPGHLVTATVRSEDELQAAIQDGWSEQAPAFGDGIEEHLSPSLQAEAERVQGQIEEARRRRGRPKATEAVA